MRNILLIFTRDFDQWVQEMIRNSLVIDCKTIWGRGLEDQLVRYTNRTFEWYRYEDDMQKLREHLIRTSLDNDIFATKRQKAFLHDVKELRAFIASPVGKSKKSLDHLVRVKALFKSMYPFYPLGIFIPGPWREPFLAIHGKEGEKILERLRAEIVFCQKLP